MFTIEKEIFVRRLLLGGVTYREISNRADVGMGIISEIKKSPRMLDRSKPRQTSEMISVAKEKKIFELAPTKKTNSQIAEMVGCSATTVYKVRKLSEPRRRKSLKENYHPQTHQENNRDEGNNIAVKRVYDGQIGGNRVKTERCPTCGGMITVWPCIICNLESS